MMAQSYQNLEDPERARVLYAKAARRIPKRTSPFSPSKKKNKKTNKSPEKLSSKKKKGRGKESKEEKEEKDANEENEKDVFVSDDEGTTDDEAEEDLESIDGATDLLNPIMAAMEKSELVSKFGAFWAGRRHYELATVMMKGSLLVDEHRQDWWTLLATCLKRQGQNTEAVEAVERAQALVSASGKQ